MNTHKKALFVTGGARRIGKAIALHFAGQGYDIALHYNSSAAEAEQVAKEITAKGVACILLRGDLADATILSGLIEQAFAKFPHLNVLVNSASVFEKGTIKETAPDLFDRQWQINFRAPYFLTQMFAQHVSQGVVVNMLDSYTERHKTAYAAYILSKKALRDFTLMAAHELGPRIRVNGVSIGITELSQNLEDEAGRAFLERKLKELPLRRLVPVSDIVAGVDTLVHNRALTGQIIYADSGDHLL